MKNKIIKNYYFFIVLTLLSFPLSASAAKGCCSHHGGINSCGNNGYYICNDGTESTSCLCYYNDDDIDLSENSDETYNYDDIDLSKNSDETYYGIILGSNKLDNDDEKDKKNKYDLFLPITAGGTLIYIYYRNIKKAKSHFKKN